MSQRERWSKNGIGTGGTDSCTFFEMNGCTVYKSYAAIIGFTARNGDNYMTDNRWSNTTSKHQNELAALIGCPSRTEHEEFMRLYNELVIAHESDSEDHTPIFG